MAAPSRRFRNRAPWLLALAGIVIFALRSCRWRRLSVKSTCGVLGLTVALVVVHMRDRASAAVVFSDSFDSYLSTADFTAAWPVVAGGGGTLTTAQSQSPPNSINISAGGTQRNGRSFMETNTFSTGGNLGVGDQIVFSFDFYDDVPTAQPYRQYSNLQDSTAALGANMLISMGLNNNQTAADGGGQHYMARILGYTPTNTSDPDGGPPDGGILGNGAYFKLNDFGAGLRSGGWHKLLVLISNNGQGTDYLFYVDSVLAERVSNVGDSLTIRSYDNIRLGSGVTATSQAYFDNFVVEYIPFNIPFNRPGDFDGDGDIDLGDYVILSTHLHVDVSNLGVEQAYLQGDFTKDRRIDGKDFVEFRTAYDAANGVGAFVATLHAIPEPSTGLLIAAACGAMLMWRRTNHRRPPSWPARTRT